MPSQLATTDLMQNSLPQNQDQPSKGNHGILPIDESSPHPKVSADHQKIQIRHHTVTNDRIWKYLENDSEKAEGEDSDCEDDVLSNVAFAEEGNFL